MCIRTSVIMSLMVWKRRSEKTDLKSFFLSCASSCIIILTVPVIRNKIMNTIPKVNGITKGSKPKMILSFKTYFVYRVH